MLGETYVQQRWSVQPERLFEFLYLIRSQESSRLQRWFLSLNYFHPFRDLFKQRLFRIRSTRAVVEHYNINPEFMSLILGPSLSYTCAFFEPDFSLEDAQANKLKIISERISLRRGLRVLDLGSGWGAAAFPLAEIYGCEVTGLTISSAQAEFCKAKQEKSLAKERLEFLKMDYAAYSPPKQFDRVVSIGMLEHVGKYGYRDFFNRIGEFLTIDGLALIHSMVEERETSPDEWVDRHIFPGGYIPTVSEVIAGIERSNCQILKVFTHDKSNYFRTLECWTANLCCNRASCERVLLGAGLNAEDVRTILRIWEYFLSASQIAFSEKYGRCRVAHFLVRKKT
jgi:cyclopropane-fatty-acyl-phospholipid synthase